MQFEKKTLIAGIVTAVWVIMFLLLTFISPSSNNEEYADTSISTVTSVPQLIITNEATREETEQICDMWEIVVPDELESMVGYGEYWQQTFNMEQSKEEVERLNLVGLLDEEGEPLLTLTGHRVYESDDGGRYIISGYTVKPLENGVPVSADYLREEGTGRRIYVFYTEQQQQAFLDKREAAERLLSDRSMAAVGTVIVDGKLTELSFARTGDNFYINLREVMKEVYSYDAHKDGDPVFTAIVNEFQTCMIPTDEIRGPQGDAYRYDGAKFQFNGWNGTGFSFRTGVLNSKTYSIDTVSASRMFGWRFFTDGTILQIVTDEMNDSSLSIVYPTGLPITSKMIQEEDGTWIVEKRSPDGQLVSREVWNGDGNPDDYDTDENGQDFENEGSEDGDTQNDFADTDAVGEVLNENDSAQ